jgi:hypothetical protein
MPSGPPLTYELMRRFIAMRKSGASPEDIEAALGRRYRSMANKARYLGEDFGARPRMVTPKHMGPREPKETAKVRAPVAKEAAVPHPHVIQSDFIRPPTKAQLMGRRAFPPVDD